MIAPHGLCSSASSRLISHYNFFFTFFCFILIQGASTVLAHSVAPIGVYDDSF